MVMVMPRVNPWPDINETLHPVKRTDSCKATAPLVGVFPALRRPRRLPAVGDPAIDPTAFRADSEWKNARGNPV